MQLQLRQKSEKDTKYNEYTARQRLNIQVMKKSNPAVFVYNATRMQMRNHPPEAS